MSGCKKPITAFINAIDKSATAKILQGTSNGSGRRLYPSSTPKNDALKHFRVDQGTPRDPDCTAYDIIVQPNAQSTSPGVLDFIKKYSTHAKLATMTIDKGDGDGPSDAEVRAALLADFKRREEEVDFS
jgi:hypothetical protein